MAQSIQDILKSGGLEGLKKLARKRKEQTESTAGKTLAVRSVSRCTDPKRVSFPLTNAQQSLWILDQFLDDRRAYNNPVAIRCQMVQAIDPDMMKRAFQSLVQRYDILRTTFHLQAGQICQQVSSEIDIPFQFVDVSHLSEQDMDAYIDDQAKASCHQLFDLEKSPLLDYKLLDVGGKAYIILLTFHHIISDGWTVHLFFQRLMESYFQLQGGMTLEKADELQFTDYALAEQQWIEAGEYQKELDYWQKKLGGVRGMLELATDRPRPPTMTTKGSQSGILLDTAFCKALQSIAAQNKAMVFHVILAAYQVLLHKYSGQDEIIVGVPFANRNHPETNQMPGLFMNTLPLCFDMTKVNTLRSVLAAAKAESETAAAHQDVPLNMILDAINYQRQPQINPLYQAVLSYQVYPQTRINPWFTYQPLKVDYGFAKVDLNLWVEEVDDNLLLTMNYNTALFDQQTIKQMMVHLRMILTVMTEQPECTVQALSLLDETEKTRYRSVGIADESALLTPVHQQFEHQAQLSPDAIATRCEQRTLSYEMLNVRANRMAHFLLARGLLVGERVAVVMEKSEQSLVAILAILKAGGSFVPVDHNLPVFRQNLMFDNAGVRFILVNGSPTNSNSLTTNSLTTNTLTTNTLTNSTLTNSPAPETTIECIDIAVSDDPALSGENLGMALAPDAVAYIMYTSGSTGTPKGVRVGHDQLSHYCQAIQPVLDQPAGARYGMFSAFTTDLAYTMVFPALTQQGQLEIITPAQLDDPQALQHYLAAKPLDCMKITPGHLSAFMAASNAQDFLPRGVLVLGGERLYRDLIDTIRTLQPDCRIVNHYGPTECTVGVCTWEVPSSLSDKQGDVLPIGQPLAGNEVLLLDEHRQPVPDGIPGEIYIGGSQVAQAYVGLEEQTAQCFVAHPWIEYARLYRTGDKGRRLPDGTVAFLGRLDRQCKVRGYRVELAEIEHVISQLPGVSQAAVCQSPVNPAQELLVAYWCGDEVDQKVVQMALLPLLPHFMQPDVFIYLASLPLNAGGKVDYRKLPAPEMPEEGTQQEAAALSKTAKTVSALYAQVLNRQSVDPRASFMALGGNSIIALKLVIEINKVFDRTLSLGLFVQHNSVETLSAWLERSQPASPLSSLVMLNRGQPEAPVFLLVHPAGGNVMCYNKLTDGLGEACSVYGLQVADFTGEQTYNDDIGLLAAHYLREAKPVMHRPRLVIGGWSLGATIAFEMAAQFADQTGKALDVLILDQPAPQANLDDALNMSETQRLAYFAYKVGLFTGRTTQMSGEALAAMSELQQAECFLNEFQQAGLVPDNISADHFRYFLRVLKAHIAATDRYPGRLYPGNIIIAEAITLFQGRTRHADPGLGWQDYTPQPVTVLPAKGDHISMMTSPYIQQLAVTLRNVWL